MKTGGKEMKALSVVYPAGSLIAEGKKTLEVRRWNHDLSADEELIIVENHRFLLNEGDEDEGLAVAIITLGKIRKFTTEDIGAACASSFEEGWLVWEITSVEKIKKPFSAKAARKIYHLEL